MPTPQMNPMNWLLLFILFNSTLFLSAVKLNFTTKAGTVGASPQTSIKHGSLIFNL